MSWKTNSGHSDKQGVTTEEYWEIATSWLGLRERQYNSFMAMQFRDFVNGNEIRQGFVRKMVANRGSIHYLTLDEYDPANLSFTVSISTDYNNPETKYMIYKSRITQIPKGSRWNIEVSKKQTPSLLSFLFGGRDNPLNYVFHGHIKFEKN